MEPQECTQYDEAYFCHLEREHTEKVLKDLILDHGISMVANVLDQLKTAQDKTH